MKIELEIGRDYDLHDSHPDINSHGNWVYAGRSADETGRHLFATPLRSGQREEPVAFGITTFYDEAVRKVDGNEVLIDTSELGFNTYSINPNDLVDERGSPHEDSWSFEFMRDDLANVRLALEHQV